MVSTVCFTYNQASYIEDTLKGFLIQKTTFPAVYIIVDDASTDGETEKLYRWAEDNLKNDGMSSFWRDMPYGKLASSYLPDKDMSLFVIILLNENHYQKKLSNKKFDYISEWLECSKYQSMCEGDDYWTYEKKLQEQVDYLEKHSSCALVHGKAKVFDAHKESLTSQIKGGGFNSFVELLKSNKIVSLTVCIRNAAYFEYYKQSKEWQEKKQWKMGDYPCWLWLSKHYDVHFMDKIVGVYRLLPESASHSVNMNKLLDFYESNYQIQIFFANMYSVNSDYKKMLHDDYINDRIRVLCQFGQYRAAINETKLLGRKARLKSVLFVLLKSIKIK